MLREPLGESTAGTGTRGGYDFRTGREREERFADGDPFDTGTSSAGIIRKKEGG